jgi:hypothetical protein
MSLSLTSFLEVMPPLLKAAIVRVEISVLSLAFACVIAPPFEVASNVPPIVAAPEKLSAPVEVAVKFCPIVNVPKVNAPLLVI